MALFGDPGFFCLHPGCTIPLDLEVFLWVLRIELINEG